MRPPPLEKLLELLYLLPVGVVQFDRSGTVSLMNPLVVQLMLPVVGSGALHDAFAVLEPLMPDLRERMSRVPSAGPAEALGIAQGTLPEHVDAERHVQVHLHAIGGEFIAVLIDVSEQVATRRKLSIEEQRYKAIVRAIRGSAIFSIDDAGIVDSWNESAVRMFHREDGAGRSLDELVPVGPQLDDVLWAARSTGVHAVGLWVRGKNGERRWLETMLSPLEDADRGCSAGFVAVTQDHTDRRRHVESLALEASTDPLTGLLNRRAFVARHEALLAKGPGPHALLLLDLDHFKAVNDTHGHDVGDRVLVDFAQVLRRSCRDADSLGRLGGEEFGVIVAATSAPHALQVAERIRKGVQAIAIPLDDGGVVRVTTSVGCAALTDDLDASLREADEALYAAKDAGRNRVVLGTGSDSSGQLPPGARA